MMTSTLIDKVSSQNPLRRAAYAASAIGAIGSVFLTLYTGRRNSSWILMMMFVVWVLSPFVAFLWADLAARRWRARGTLYSAVLVIAAGTLAIYAVVAFGPPRHQTAAAFLIVPPASILLTALAVAASRYGSA